MVKWLDNAEVYEINKDGPVIETELNKGTELIEENTLLKNKAKNKGKD